ncbi:MAG: D-glycero-beta-D-manno-heptose-7-phosphate kinase [Ignavibacteriae bacterium]|nr:D-glycero-beta-D-manno-heptose-7-phosphate kinase [Ignavibacteriota bacterium]
MIFSAERLEDIFAPMRRKFIAIVGDVMLDRYIWGQVSRISPEAPVPVVDVLRENSNLGGAANVALNIKSLGAIPVLIGAIGDDNNGRELQRILREETIITDFLVTDTARPTTVKTRVIAGHQHVVRIDQEERTPVSDSATLRMLDKLEEHLGSLEGIILQDYNKGVIGADVIEGVVRIAAGRGIPVFVDPKYHNFFSYRGVAVFKPNRKETEDALGLRLRDEDAFLQAARTLRERLGCEHVLLTLGELGMLLLQSDGSVTRVPTRARKVADVSGAGDTVIATLATTMACGATVSEAAHLANLAGGLVCEEVGIVPVNLESLLDAATGKLGITD